MTARTCRQGQVSVTFHLTDVFIIPLTGVKKSVSCESRKFDDLCVVQLSKSRGPLLAVVIDDYDGCTFHSTCGYCPGISHAEHGEPGRRSADVCERTHVTNAAMEHMNLIQVEERRVPLPDSQEAHELLSGSTFAERQWAARRAGISKATDRLRPQLVQIVEPSR